MAESDPRPVEEDRGSDTAREILRAAARLFAARGYDATSVRELVEAAGVTKPTLYYHFGSKEGLGRALLTVPMQALIEELRGIVGRPSDPKARLIEQIEAHFAFCREEPDRARFVYALFFGPNSPGLSSQVAHYGERIAELLHESAAQLARAGVIAPEGVRRCAAAAQGLITYYTAEYLYQGANLDSGLARRLVDDLLFGFASGRRDARSGAQEADPSSSRDP